MSHYYLIQARADGRHLVAHPDEDKGSGYLLLFGEHFDALSYLNTHGANVADRFTVQSIPKTQLKALLQRWGFAGVGMVRDPLLPRIEFLPQD